MSQDQQWITIPYDLMPLPNATVAVIDREKVTNYLLNPAHPDNGGKAYFFTTMGFSVDRPEALIDALRTLASGVSPSNVVESTHGRKFIVDGEIDTPSGRRPSIRTIWIIDRGATIPRLVTAYPYAVKVKS